MNRRMPLALRLLLQAAFFVGVFTPIASWVFLRWSGELYFFDFPDWSWQWWIYAWDYLSYRDNAATWYYLKGSAAVGSLLPIAFFIADVVRRYNMTGQRPTWLPGPAVAPSIPAKRQTHGTARWSTRTEQIEALSGLDPVHGGFVVGELSDPRQTPGPYRTRDRSTWGQGGLAPMLVYNCNEGSPHTTVFGGTRSGKSMSEIPTLAFALTGPAVIFDPAVQLQPMTKWCRENYMGHTTYTLDLTTAARYGFNVCGDINVRSPTAETDVSALVERVCGHTSQTDKTAAFFAESGKSFVNCLTLDTLWNPNLAPDLKNLRTVRWLQSQSLADKKKLLRRIADTSHSLKARQLAANLIGAEADETLSGIFLNADHSTEWLSTRAYANLVSGGAFRPSDLLRGDTDVYLCLPGKNLEGTNAGVIRCILGSLLNACYDSSGANHPLVSFIFDDARLVPRMTIMETARDDAAKFGVGIRQLFQGRSQLDEIWGHDGARSWINASGVVSYARVSDLQTAKEIAESIGYRGLMTRSVSRSSQFGSVSTGRTVTTSETKELLIDPAQIMALRSDARLVSMPGMPWMILNAALWYRRREPEYRMIGRDRFFRRIFSPLGMAPAGLPVPANDRLAAAAA